MKKSSNCGLAEKEFELQELFGLLFKDSTEGHLLVTCDGRVLHCNEAALKMAGCSQKELLSEGLLGELFPGKQPDRSLFSEKERKLFNIASQRGSVRLGRTHSGAEGAEISHEVTFTAISCSGQTIFHVVVRNLHGREPKEASPPSFQPPIPTTVSGTKAKGKERLAHGKEGMYLAKENATMAEIGRIASSTLNFEEVYERFAEEVRRLISFDSLVVRNVVIDKERNIQGIT